MPNRTQALASTWLLSESEAQSACAVRVCGGLQLLSVFASQIAEQATASRRAFKADAKAAAQKANPNRRGKLWIPLILAAQIAFKVYRLQITY